MDEKDIAELAYKNGYEKGKQDAVKWIPVTEGYPVPGEFVMVYDTRDDWMCLCEFSGVAWYEKDYEMWGKHEVTHWMPLPPCPED